MSTLRFKRYVALARKYGYAAEGRAASAPRRRHRRPSSAGAPDEFPNSTVFSGNLVFSRESLVHRILHNETAFAVQRRLQWEGITNVVMPIRVASAF